ncbi:MAG: hypothetical protein P1U89_08790 [Verrucomicrobiales bacterium]|nr:hypothetical protein [Verrucomicrobiales bacterium]
MKLLILSALALIGTVFSMIQDSAATTKHYTMFAKGSQAPVTLSWKNIRGLGQISGMLEGNPIVGKNHSTGKLTLLCEGVYIELNKVREGGRFQWKGMGYNTNDCSDFEIVLVPTGEQYSTVNRGQMSSLFGNRPSNEIAAVFSN